MSRSALTVQVVGNIEREREREKQQKQAEASRIYSTTYLFVSFFFFSFFFSLFFHSSFFISPLLTREEGEKWREEKRREETYLEEKNHPRSALSRNYSRGDPSRPIFIPYALITLPIYPFSRFRRGGGSLVPPPFLNPRDPGYNKPEEWRGARYRDQSESVSVKRTRFKHGIICLEVEILLFSLSLSLESPNSRTEINNS